MAIPNIDRPTASVPPLSSLHQLILLATLIAMALSFFVMLTPLQVPGIFVLHAAILVFAAIALGRFPPDALLLSVFGICLLFLTAFSLLIDQANSIRRDYFELAKYGAVFIAILVGASVVPTRRTLELLWMFFCLVTLVLSMIGVIQTMGWDRHIPLLNDLVRDKQTLEGKPVTFFWTTYFAATAYCLMAALFLGCLADGFKNNICTHIAIGLLLGLTLLTQSRSAFLALIILTLAYALICLRRNKPLFFILVTSTVVLVTYLSVGALDLEDVDLQYLMSGLQRYVLNWREYIDGTSSLALRFAEIVDSGELNFVVLTGVGIGKGTRGHVESWIALYYYRYGLIGMALYVAFWALPIVMSILALFRPSSTERTGQRSFLYGMAIFSLLLPFLSLSSVMTDQAHFVGPMYMFAGLAYAQYRALAKPAPHLQEQPVTATAGAI